VARVASTNRPDGERGPRAGSLGLCVAPSGHVVYALAQDIDAAAFAQGLAPLKCAAVIPLSSAPAELGFTFVRGDGAAWEAQAAARRAAFDAASLAHGLDGDFVYLTRRGGDDLHRDRRAARIRPPRGPPTRGNRPRRRSCPRCSARR